MNSGILIATPAYGNQVTAAYTRSVLVTMESLTAGGIANDWLIPEHNDSLVHRARMRIARTFLDDKRFSHLFWWDADIEATPNDLAALWNLQADIAVGVYAMKRPDKQWYAAWHKGKLVHDLDQFDGPIEVDYAGTGFMLISRAAMQRVMARLRFRRVVATGLKRRVEAELDLSEDERSVLAQMYEATAPDWHDEDDTGQHRVPALFMTPIHNDGLESEDYSFCRLAREAGCKVIMDPKVRLKHWGSYAYGA